jgi:hypothetical protein
VKDCIVCKKKSRGGGYLAHIPLCRKHTDVLIVCHMMSRLGISRADLAETSDALKPAAQENPK